MFGCIAFCLYFVGMTALLHSNGMGYHWHGAYNPALADVMGERLQARGNDLPPQIKLGSMLGTYLRQQYHGRLYAKAQNLRPGLRASYDAVLQQVDVLAMPTTPRKARPYRPQLGIEELIMHGWNISANTVPFDMTGHPAISIPCAKSNGLPVGLMLTGRQFDDATVLAVAHAFEQQVDWEKR
jgi:amidase